VALPTSDTSGAILQTAMEVIAERGVHGLTVEGVAARCGVAKTTIYRRWRSKEDLALAALVGMVDQLPARPLDLGDTRVDLVAFVMRLVRALGSTLVGRVIHGLVSDLASDPELARAFREQVVARRAAELDCILERGVERGEVRPGARTGIALDLLLGPVYYRLLLSGMPLTREFAEEVVDAFLASTGTGKSPE
jgi:AcrR family transcriptional regulator